MRVVVTLGLAFIAGCGPNAADERPIFVSEEVGADFANHPDRFRGKTLIATVWHTGADARVARATLTLRASAGSTVGFALASEKTKLKFNAKLPANPEKVPEARYGTTLVVTFLCREGKLDAGNEILKIVSN